jgi:hypothetical protein
MGSDQFHESLRDFRRIRKFVPRHRTGILRVPFEEISVDEDGMVWGSFSNGQSQALYQVGLAVFSNYNGLSSQGSNVFSETVNSGVGIFGTADTGGRGTISPGSLEQSNVDLAEEFVRMITIQRAYQANSKVITTSSDISAGVGEHEAINRSLKLRGLRRQRPSQSYLEFRFDRWFGTAEWPPQASIYFSIFLTQCVGASIW